MPRALPWRGYQAPGVDFKYFQEVTRRLSLPGSREQVRQLYEEQARRTLYLLTQLGYSRNTERVLLIALRRLERATRSHTRTRSYVYG